MHSLALGVRHAGIIARNTTTPWPPSGFLQGSRRHIGTENVTTILSTVLLSFSTRTYTVVGSIHFMVFRRIYTVFPIASQPRTTGASR